MADVITLEKCPHCGAEADFIYTYDSNNIATSVKVQCTNEACGCMTPFISRAVNENARLKSSEIWNTRANAVDNSDNTDPTDPTNP